MEIYNLLEEERMQMELSFDTYMSWKKEVVKVLKEWDKLYVTFTSKKGTC